MRALYWVYAKYSPCICQVYTRYTPFILVYATSPTVSPAPFRVIHHKKNTPLPTPTRELRREDGLE